MTRENQIFKEIDYADELGSGVRNLYKYSKVYGGDDPMLIEEDVFRITVVIDGGLVGKRTTPQVSDQVSDQASDQASGQAILRFCITPKSAEEIMEYLDLKHKSYFRKTFLDPLIKKGMLLPTIPDKPTSPKQKYITKGNP